MMAIEKVTIVGLGLIGSSIARAVRERLPDVTVTGHDASADVREQARALGLCDEIADDPVQAVAGADLVILAVPVGRMADAGAAIAPGLKADAIISDVGSSKSSVADALTKVLPGHVVIPAHPVAGTENSGPAAGFATLFEGRWCIVTPGAGAPADAVATLGGFWEALGAKVDLMDAAHHDMVLAVTSHLPHLIAYTIVGTASELEEVTESEVIKYSAGGFRDFTRIAASDPVMWRDVFLANRDAVLETLQRFNEDLTVLQQAIRRGDAGKLEDWFTRTRAIRRSIIEQGQDDAAPDFGRKH
ncbi:prephenate/arogenate dehydrogenase family protein [Sphingopyxis sp. BSN-002]|uniref:prephenate/arogenate dehydrogenase family protein n=1 Tax=Sphingopyxis sp. BSN-002 TaxID=2911495 RepID=UPI001EDBAA1B|nr:prephenate/arogenate dehydrogenase family protein [Sphingopyxis sp. BSN-002]UKK86317.1 prephenate/arogenate dehydrogenase family protein [Sphingopyxis sp. BSN-002]